MATTVGQHQVSTITDPADGSAMVASTMRTATNAVRAGANDHDSDSGVHFQSSASGSRPAAGTAGRKWLDTDTLLVKYDNGVSWDDIAYLKSSGGTVTGAVTVSAGGIAVTGNSTITGTLTALTGITSTGTASFADVTVSGTFSPVSVSVTNPEATGPALVFNPSSGSSAQVHTKNSCILSFDNVAETKRLLKLDFNVQRVSLAETAGTDVILGAAGIATNATAGFTYLATCAGAATGSPDLARAGAAVLDTTNNRIYFYNGTTWKYAALT